MKYVLTLFLLTISFLPQLTAQVVSDTLPKVFLIGEHEAQYNKMIANSPDLLMSVCKNDMDKAYAKWLSFLVGLEKAAIENDVNINGVKIWINVFWDEKGAIKHIAFYPKPNSKNMEYEYLSALLKEYAGTFEVGLENTKMFAHYGSASFPSFISSTEKQNK